MRNLLTATTLAALTLVLTGGSAAIAQKTDADSQMPIHGTVVSVNRADGTVILRYTPPGSQPATKHTFSLANRNDVLRLRPGAVVDGTADTTPKVWVLSNLNVESDKPLKGQTSP
jgi:hypothetical protein